MARDYAQFFLANENSPERYIYTFSDIDLNEDHASPRDSTDSRDEALGHLLKAGYDRDDSQKYLALLEGQAWCLSGDNRYVIFHRDCCPTADPGAITPKSFREGEFIKGPWFFQPMGYCEQGNSPLLIVRTRQRTGYPIEYSPGYATRQEAISAAQEWEKKRLENERRQKEALDSIFGETAPYTVALK